MFIVVTYDIMDDRRRNRVAKTMEDYGTRVQYSVFECILEETYFTEMINTLMNHINQREDSIRFYILCKGCITSVKILGKGGLTEDKDVFII
ncbi:MAG: CRISPR-associated endonuclease Cas2 [Candidatus Brocadia sp. UTAMX1]|jgi:CRISPR-associated protein Cas2|nr:MAG: CRISPR-associated endonuclease Cas2 [Candidatus Brocadia sp. UTAMX1]